MNHIMVAGNLGADPEVRFTSTGQKVTTMRIASNTRRGGKDETTWWRITVWGENFDKMISYLKKGSSVMVWGDMSKPEIFNDRNGQPQVSLNVTAYNISFSPFGRSGNGQQQQGEGQHSAQSDGSYGDMNANEFSGALQGGGQGPAAHTSFPDDEIPF